MVEGTRVPYLFGLHSEEDSWWAGLPGLNKETILSLRISRFAGPELRKCMSCHRNKRHEKYMYAFSSCECPSTSFQAEGERVSARGRRNVPSVHIRFGDLS